MLTPSSLKFSIVLEDPNLELAVLERRQAKGLPCAQLLTVASGGCTALTLKHAYPQAQVCAFDINPAQIEHAKRRQAAIREAQLHTLNVDDADPQGLSQCGDCERLFRAYRGMLHEFIAPQAELERYFEPSTSQAERAGLVARWRSSPFWETIHELIYGAQLFHLVFGAQATQHTAPGSYPAHVRRSFERGLERADGATNPFLQHIFMGRYLRADAPAVLAAGRDLQIDWITGSLDDVGELGRFDLLQLSNIFDWSPEAFIRDWIARLERQVRPGAVVMIRQLNNHKTLAMERLSHSFELDETLAQELLARDRSLLYNGLIIATRKGAV